ncbi:GmrSD restriction endonuclease domain-containing protein, partial [Gilliamella sp. Fer4-1]
MTEEVKNKWLHSIANLTLLSGKKNIDASNNPFNIKMTVYQGNH